MVSGSSSLVAVLVAGEPVHRDDLDAVAPVLLTFGQPCAECLLGAALDHVRQPGGAGGVPHSGEVDDDGGVPVLAAGAVPVGLVRGAVVALLPLRFPEPSAEPGVRVSPYWALRVRLLLKLRCLSGSTGSGCGSRGSGTGRRGR